MESSATWSLVVVIVAVRMHVSVRVNAAICMAVAMHVKKASLAQERLVGKNFCGNVVRDDAALVQDDAAIGDIGDAREVVRRDDDGSRAA